MAKFYMTEGFAGIMMAEQSPGRGWREAPCKDEPTGAPTGRSVTELGAALAIEIARSRELRRQYAEDRLASPEMPADETFVDVVDRLVQAGMSYGQACRETSQMRPDLYAEHRAAAMLNG
jgi:hypothetical protein